VRSLVIRSKEIKSEKAKKKQRHPSIAKMTKAKTPMKRA
jgi:hypothetical protein